MSAINYGKLKITIWNQIGWDNSAFDKYMLMKDMVCQIFVYGTHETSLKEGNFSQAEAVESSQKYLQSLLIVVVASLN